MSLEFALRSQESGWVKLLRIGKLLLVVHGRPQVWEDYRVLGNEVLSSYVGVCGRGVEDGEKGTMLAILWISCRVASVYGVSILSVQTGILPLPVTLSSSSCTRTWTCVFMTM